MFIIREAVGFHTSTQPTAGFDVNGFTHME